MSNTSENDNAHVTIVMDSPANDEGKTNQTPPVPIVPDVPDAVNLPKEGETRRTGNPRGRQLNPGTGGRRSRSNSRSPKPRVRRDIVAAQNDAIPLLPIDGTRVPSVRPPTAEPEFDEDDGRENYDPNDTRGIDDGLVPDQSNKDDAGRRSPGRRPSNFPYAPEYGPTGPPGPPVIHTDGTRVIPDVNVYQQKKNLAQGMMDLALLSANANQLRYVLESYKRHPYFYVNLVFISTSIICQVAVGIGLIWKSRYDIKKNDDFCKADRINNLITIGIFLITLVNVLISAFGVAEPTTTT